MSGASPPGATSESQAARWVRDMFSRVAPRYDLANHLLSLNLDRRWRANAVCRLQPILDLPAARILDICCGTGDLTASLTQAHRKPVFGADFSHAMLTRAGRKQAGRLFEADALALPLAANALDLLTCAFGFRNLANYQHGIAEFHRVLKPGGVCAILEFSHPPSPLFARAYAFYSRYLLPRVGGLLTGSPDAYAYLPSSIVKFPTAPVLAAQLRATGFGNVTWQYFTFGIVALHMAQKE